jgi:2-hydroxy-6-oxonona-2,4-dienedioate hydrolase
MVRRMAELSYESTSRFLELESGKIHYHEAGEGPVLLMLHGSGPGVTGWANFSGNLPYFAEHFRCIIVDFPGYGKSEPVQGDPISVCVQAAVAALDGLGIEKASLLGNSLGGQIASIVAAKHADRVERLVCIGGIGMNVFSPFPAEGLNLLMEFTENPTRERLTQWLHSMVFDPQLVTEELIESRFKQATDPVTMATSKKIYSRKSLAWMSDMRRGPKATMALAHLGSIQAPTLLTWGRDDRVNPLDSALMPMRLIPKCELHVFPNCGHWVMIEQKHAFETLVRAFLQRDA